MNEEVKSSFLIIKKSLKLSLKNFHFVGIFVVLGWILEFIKMDTTALFSTCWFLLYGIVSLYIIAGIYPCIWANIISRNPNFEFFTSSAKRFFLDLFVVMIGVGVLGWLISLPFFLFWLLYNNLITKISQDYYKLAVDLCNFLGLCLTIYIYPFLFKRQFSVSIEKLAHFKYFYFFLGQHFLNILSIFIMLFVLFFAIFIT